MRRNLCAICVHTMIGRQHDGNVFGNGSGRVVQKRWATHHASLSRARDLTDRDALMATSLTILCRCCASVLACTTMVFTATLRPLQVPSYTTPSNNKKDKAELGLSASPRRVATCVPAATGLHAGPQEHEWWHPVSVFTYGRWQLALSQ